MADQFRIIDINRWWRTGGTDYQELKASCDIAIIQACAGTKVNEILDEQIGGCKAVGLDYETYAVPAADKDPAWMADFYLDLPGVMEAPKWADIEPTDGKFVNASQAKAFIDRINQKSPGPAGYYSNYNSTNKIGNPVWIKDMDVWWAEYPLYFTGLGWSKYKHFDKFNEDKPWWNPKWATRLGIGPVLHQFTDKGRAQVYGAKATTDHPIHTTGIQSADLNVGLITLDQYRDKRFGPYGAPPLPEPDIIDFILATLANHEDRIVTLENFHKTVDPPVEPPVEPPHTSVRARATKDPHCVAWAQTTANANGVPVIETNAFVATKDPALKFVKDKVVFIQPKAITSDGGQRWYELDMVPLHSYPKLYVHKEDVMKIVS